MNRFHRIQIMAAAILTAVVATAQPQGFSYQAVVRNAQGELVNNSNVGLRLTIADSTGSQIMYSETQTVQTNAYGVLSVTVGSGKSDAKRLQDVNWASDNVWLHVEVDVTGGTNYTGLGATKIQAVPVALYAARSGSNSQTASPSTANTSSTDALFEVKDKDGNVIFAVYPDGVRVYVDDNDGSKAARSGFLVTGRTATKDGETKDYFAVNGGGTQVYVDDDPDGYGDKAARSGFLVTGRTATKDGSNADLLSVNGGGTKVYVDDDENKAARSGFLITGRTATKGVNADLLSVDGGGTKVFIDDNNKDGKAARSGFLVTGRTATKAEPTNYLDVSTTSTKVHFDGGNSKAARSGFLVTGRTATKGSANEYFNIDAAKDAKVINNENRVYWYPEKNAFMAGNLRVSNAAQVGTNSFNAGYQNIASGNYSQAMGYMSTAKGDYSTAIGRKANAGALRSFAFGDSAQATGRCSYALGDGAVASGMNSYAIGGGFNALVFGERLIFKPARAINDFAYAIGPGTLADKKCSMAIGVADTASGDCSIAIGFQSKANWGFATAMGYQSRASSWYSVAIGARAIVERGCSDGFAIGNEAVCEAETAVAIGYRTKATGSQSTAIGISANSIGSGSFALGCFAKSEGFGSTAIGDMTRAIGENSTAMGIRTRAYSYGETVVGFDNTEYTPEEQNDDGEEPATNRLFVVGNGRYEYEYTYDEETDEEHEWDTICYSDALIIYKNGDAEFRGNIYPSAEKNVWTEKTTYTLGTSTNKWDKVYASNGTIQTSDQRLKTNIKPLERALDKVITLNGVTYNWRVKEFPNKNFDSNRHVGVLAQELEAVLPEAVETGEDGYKSVNYSNITPLLIEAIKELKAEKDELQKEVDELKRMMEELMKKQ